MPPPPDLHDDVKALVLAWAETTDITQAAQVLAEGRRGLDPSLMPQLWHEVAELSCEVLLALLEKPDDSDPATAVEVPDLGVSLLPIQGERYGTWLLDQLQTGHAVGAEPDRWAKEIQTAMARILDALTGGEKVRAAATELASAKRLLGTEGPSFKNPPPAGSGQNGLSGMLAARRFQQSGDDKDE